MPKRKLPKKETLDERTKRLADGLLCQVERHLMESEQADMVLRPNDIEVLTRSLERVQKISKVGEDLPQESTGGVQIYIPSNGRDNVQLSLFDDSDGK